MAQRNLVILVNGTWNDSGKDRQPKTTLTNVMWLKDICVGDGTNQDVWYTNGVGTKNLIDKGLGGATGFGLTELIVNTYLATSERYKLGTKIFLFGFSRGAYVVRTVADIITQLGLPDLREIPEKKRKKYCRALFLWYRKNQVSRSRWDKVFLRANIDDLEDLKFYNSDAGSDKPSPTKVHFIGVWDTVGTAGIPDHYRTLNALDKLSKRHNWANARISEHVCNARHAVAMDELRHAFVPAFWTNDDGEIMNDEKVVQKWFAGVHADIGGGYEHRDLGNIAMSWMVSEASEKGLQVQLDHPDWPKPEVRAMGTVNDSLTPVFKRMWTRPRGIPNVFDDKNKHLFHDSVFLRYRDANRPSQPNWRHNSLTEEGVIRQRVWAKDQWTKFELYIEPDQQYEILADGFWYNTLVDLWDRKIERKFKPNGTRIDSRTGQRIEKASTHRFSRARSYIANFFAKEGDTPRVAGALRCPKHPPFMLMGVVANGRGVVMRESRIFAKPHDEFPIGLKTRIGRGTEIEFDEGGYLYCFPNHIWNFYAQNSGSVDVSVKLIR